MEAVEEQQEEYEEEVDGGFNEVDVIEGDVR